jgi:myo-inositol 2-dehydrogenase/D-chiro-inositol 1-dehydrogenase
MARSENVLDTTVEIARESGFQRAPAQHFFLERYAEAYRRELAAFIDAVSGGRPPSPGGRDGLQAQRLADAATESRETGRPVAVRTG